MTQSRSYSPADNHLSCDILVAGGGIVGLWVARLAEKAGLHVVLLEKDRIGCGASGGFLGALMPHMPERWNPKKQFQFQALATLPDRVAAIEAETGRSCGYRRCGRLLPLARPHHAALAGERRAAAEAHWDHPPHGFAWEMRQRAYAEGWPSADAMPHGLVLETLAARINPRLYVAALKASLGGAVMALDGEALDRFDDAAGRAITSHGRTIAAGRTVLAAGHASFPFLGRLLDRPPEAFGMPVKGQAALLDAKIDPDLPLVFQDGIYVVPHEGGLAAVGSTSETDFDDPFSTDGQLDTVIARARALCPPLAGAPVLERWASLRPKAVRRDPMVGFVPGHSNLLVATGGFKISFGIAHDMARCVLEQAEHGDCAMPESFRVEHHLGRM